MRKLLVTFLAIGLAGACARTPPEQQLLDDAAAAMGGRDRLLAVRTLTLEGGGTDGAVGGSTTPEAPPNTFKVTDYRRSYDLAGRRMRVQQVRTAQFPFALAVVTRQHQGLDGDVAFNVGQDGMAARTSNEVARDRRLEMLQHPVVLMREALQTGAYAENLRTENGRPQVDLTTQANGRVTVAFDPESKLPARVSFPSYDPNWGDIVITAEFSGYQDAGGLKVPAQIVTRQDQWLTADRRMTKTTIDADTGDLAAPETVRAAAPPEPPPVNVTVEEVAPGIWWLAGGTHHSVVFEFENYLMLFEVPLTEARTKAVIDKARSLRPDKPLTFAVVSHHHLDHAGGFRTAVAEGLQIVTHRGNEKFFRELAGRPHRTGTATKAPMFYVVDDFTAFSDKMNTVHLFKANGNIHSELLLYAWVPRQRMLIQADFYDVNWLWHPWGDNFLENLKARNLAPRIHVPIHGRIQTHEEVLRTLASKPKGPPAT